MGGDAGVHGGLSLGGRHGYYPALSSVVQRSWQAARAGVDFRGDGGYIVIPPSHTTVGSYRLATVREGVAAGIDSDTLREFLDPRPVLQSRTAADRGVAQNEPGMVVSRLAAWVAGLGEGERNRGLFWAACRAATHYDPAVLAVEHTDEQVTTFLRVIEHTVAFADALQAALTNPDDTTTAACGTVDERNDGPAGGRPQLRAI